jgi:hypothetical protein
VTGRNGTRSYGARRTPNVPNSTTMSTVRWNEPVFFLHTSNQEDTTMDWIERLFGISPDGGDGSTEMLYLVAAVAIVALICGRTLFVRRTRRRRG